MARLVTFNSVQDGSVAVEEHTQLPSSRKSSDHVMKQARIKVMLGFLFNVPHVDDLTFSRWTGLCRCLMI